MQSDSQHDRRISAKRIRGKLCWRQITGIFQRGRDRGGGGRVTWVQEDNFVSLLTLIYAWQKNICSAIAELTTCNNVDMKCQWCPTVPGGVCVRQWG